MTNFSGCPAQAMILLAMPSSIALTGGTPANCRFAGVCAHTRGALLDPDEQATAGHSVATTLSIAANAAAALSPRTAAGLAVGPLSEPGL